MKETPHSHKATAALCVLALVLGALLAYLAEPWGLVPAAQTLALGGWEIALLAFAVFLMCALFFGRLAPLAMLLGGILLYPFFEASPLLFAAGLVALSCCGWAGKKFGEALYADFHGEGNVYDKKSARSIVFYLAIGLIVAAAVALLHEMVRPLEEMAVEKAGALWQTVTQRFK